MSTSSSMPAITNSAKMTSGKYIQSGRPNYLSCLPSPHIPKSKIDRPLLTAPIPRHSLSASSRVRRLDCESAKTREHMIFKKLLLDF